MSDKLLERIAVALEGILAVATATGGKAPAAAAATPPKPAATPPKPTPPKPADKAPAAAGAKAADKKPAAAPAATKAPGGKYNSEQVRAAIRAVAAKESLGKQSARDVLTEDGGGAPTVSELKPEYFDAVYEACQVLLSSEGGGGDVSADPDDPTA